MADLMQERNAEVVGLAEARRYRTERREDGEVVIRLPGKAGAYAGRWGVDLSYLLVSCAWPGRRVKILQARWPSLIDRSGDVELLVLGPHGAVEAILAAGPSWARARKRKSPGAAGHLTAFRKTPTAASSGRHFDERGGERGQSHGTTTTEALLPRHGRARARMVPGAPEAA